MCEVIPFDASLRRSSSSPLQQKTPPLPYETYRVYRQAEEAFRAVYFGRDLDLEAIEGRASARVVQRHWSAVVRLAETLLRGQSLTREQAVKLLLQTSLDEAPSA